jgi:hypothetical protein
MRIDHKSNYVVACAECNETKADTPYEIFTYWLRQQGIKHGLSNRKDYRRFCYDLMRAGFVAAIALINYREKARETGGGSQMSRRRRAAAESAELVKYVAPAPRDSHGRYTLRDLRKPAIGAQRSKDRAVVEEAQRALATLDNLSARQK